MDSGLDFCLLKIVIWSNDMEFDDFYLQFRLAVEGKGNIGRVFLDDICLTGIRWDFAGHEYGYKSGTSVAAPVASGIAGLVFQPVPDFLTMRSDRSSWTPWTRFPVWPTGS